MPGTLKKLLLILLLATGLVVLAVRGRSYPLRLEAEHWRRQLAAASDQEAAALIHSTAWDQESQPIALLVEALASGRTCVREAAAEALGETVARWPSLRGDEQLRRVDNLAAALLDQTPGFDARACREAESLMTQILQLPRGGDPAERGRTIALCQQVLAALADRDRTVSVAESKPTAASITDTASATRHELPPPSMGVDGLPQLPGGAIPVDSFSLPQLPIFAAKEAATVDSHSEPAPLAMPTQSQPLRPQSPGATAADGLAAASDPTTKGRRPLRGGVMKAGSLAEFRSKLGITRVAAVTGLEQNDTMDLMRQLNSTDATIVAQARTELLQRGLTDFHLKFGRKLFDPDPAVRREVAQMLPGLPGLDVAPWLLYLCRDDDAEVRLTAVSLIVTTGNPALLERAEAIARGDEDPRIQNQGEQIAQSRRQTAASTKLR
jgi:hypothetical protein